MKAATILFTVFITAFSSCKEQPTYLPPDANADYSRGEALMWKNNDSAFYYFSNVVSNAKDSLLIAMALNNMAVIQSAAGDYFGSMETLLSSLQAIDEQEARNRWCVMADYNELGNVSLNLKNYTAAIDYYNKALQLMDDDVYKTIALNNKAVAYRKLKKYNEAIGVYTGVLEKSKADSLEFARVSSNLAITKWLKDSTYNAAPALLAALSVRRAAEDKEGLVASYMHLSDYYTKTQPALALHYAEQLDTAAKELGNADDEVEALNRLIVLASPAKAKTYFARYGFLADSLQTARNAAKNQFALVRYESGKTKTENLRLQAENTRRQSQVIMQWAFIIVVVTAFVVVVLFITQRNRRKKQLLQWQAQQELQQYQLKTSQKIHDVVANGLYRIMSAVEYTEVVDKEQLLDDIEVLYEQSRDISYEKPEKVSTDNFHETLSAMLQSFANSHVKVFLTGNSEMLWTGFDTTAKHTLKLVLQELMVNMKKHSHATTVLVKFEMLQNILHIQYTDDGNGLPAFIKNGNGLTSTENRIHKLGGTLTFDNKSAGGLQVNIAVPVATV